MSRTSNINLLKTPPTYSNSKMDELNNEEPILFNIYDYGGNIIDSIRGTTNQDINSPKMINYWVNKHCIILESERYEIGELSTPKFLKDDIIKIRKETNWKLRVLHERDIIANKKERMEEEELEAAEALLKLSRNKEMATKRKANKKERETLQPIRRSIRLANKEQQEIYNACPGCQEDQPNQMAHMGSNGCLGGSESNSYY